MSGLATIQAEHSTRNTTEETNTSPNQRYALLISVVVNRSKEQESGPGLYQTRLPGGTMRVA
jgi:hypothetical protein